MEPRLDGFEAQNGDHKRLLVYPLISPSIGFRV